MNLSKGLIFITALLLFLTHCKNKGQNPKGGEKSHAELELFENTLSELQNEKVSGYVLISHNAHEHQSIQQARKDQSTSKAIVHFDTEHLDLHTPNDTKIEGISNWGSNLICKKVIKDWGNIVEVENLQNDEKAKLGHGGLEADHMIKIRTFLRKRDLIPVVKKQYKIRFRDKTLIQFDPGVAVGLPWKSMEYKRSVSIQELHFGFDIPDSVLSLSYTPILSNLELPADSKMLDEHSDLILNGKKFGPVAEIRSTRLRTPIIGAHKGNRHLVDVAADGIFFRFHAGRNTVPSYIPNIESPPLRNKLDQNPKWFYRVPKGTAVYWDNGEVAGEVRQDFTYPSEIEASDSSWCEEFREFLPNQPICFKLSDIQIEQVVE